MKLIIKILGIVFLIGFLQSCYWDNEEDLYPQAIACDTTSVTYSGTIADIMENNCNDCHSGDLPQGNIITDNYNSLKTIAENGRLWGAVNHESGYSPMPKNLPKLNECNLSKIRIWIEQGALDN